MGVRINTNIEALDAQRNLFMNSLSFSKSVEKLSSGLRINRAADDAAGLSISQKLQAQAKGLNQASRNAQDGISLVQTAEGAMNEIHGMLQRMRELVVQAQNGTLATEDISAIQSEVDALSSEIDRIATATEFNTTAILDGTTTTVTLQVGANDSQTMALTMQDVTASTLGVSTVTVNGTSALTDIDTAIDTVSSARSNLGAYQNRLEHTIANLAISAENLQASESRIRDLDVAAEMVNLTRAQILNQSGTAVLAQANSAPQSVLSLLR
ncbi:MAG: flagellin FliC [Chloroflexota bacterium]|nr:MAG: flagellin FliC [Chloroflexota bacterium]